jgi:hypothetical protein
VSRSYRNLNLILIQISLKFIKDLEKKRGFSIFPSLMVQEGTFARETLALQAGIICSGTVAKHDILL